MEASSLLVACLNGILDAQLSDYLEEARNWRLDDMSPCAREGLNRHVSTTSTEDSLLKLSARCIIEHLPCVDARDVRAFPEAAKTQMLLCARTFSEWCSLRAACSLQELEDYDCTLIERTRLNADWHVTQFIVKGNAIPSERENPLYGKDLRALDGATREKLLIEALFRKAFVRCTESELYHFANRCILHDLPQDPHGPLGAIEMSWSVAWGHRVCITKEAVAWLVVPVLRCRYLTIPLGFAVFHVMVLGCRLGCRLAAQIPMPAGLVHVLHRIHAVRAKIIDYTIRAYTLCVFGCSVLPPNPLAISILELPSMVGKCIAAIVLAPVIITVSWCDDYADDLEAWRLRVQAQKIEALVRLSSALYLQELRAMQVFDNQ